MAKSSPKDPDAAVDAKGGPDVDAKPDLAADAHWRIDDLARQLATLTAKVGDHEKAAAEIVKTIMEAVDQRVEQKIAEVEQRRKTVADLLAAHDDQARVARARSAAAVHAHVGP